jgi:general secretion pathway protein C
MDLVHKINGLRARPAAYWVTAANQNLPAWSSWLLVIAIAWYGARLLWAVMPQQDEFDWSVRGAPTTAQTGTIANASAVDYSRIAAAHLFGVAGADPVITQAVDAPETRLDLKLRGTVAADDSAMAHAIIADGRGNDNVYFLQDKIPGGATLHQVYSDRVIINRAGALETLKLPKLSESLGNQAGPSGARPTPTSSSPRPSLQSAMQESGTTFTDILRPQPFMPNGELKGYRVYPGRDRRKFAALGFRPGDLVTEINGQKLDNLQSGVEVFREIASMTQLNLTIERGGQPVVISIDTDQVNSATGNTQ